MEAFHWIKEKGTWMDRLKAADKPIVLYGMGNGADKLFSLFEKRGIRVSAVFASDDFVRGHSFRGYRVQKYAEIRQLYGRFIIVVAFATDLPAVMDRIRGMDSEQELIYPDLPVFGEDVLDFAYLSANQEWILAAYEQLADDASREVFAGLVNFRLSGKLPYLYGCTTPRKDALRQILALGDKEAYLDLGAYNGDTIREFLKIAGGYSRIIAVEPAEKNFEKLQKYIGQSDMPRISLFHMGAYNARGELHFSEKSGRHAAISQGGRTTVPVDTVDNLLAGERVTYVKMDVEGAEAEVLQGMRETIRRHAPKLSISAYHHMEDLFRLPLLVRELNPDYRIYLRKHPYFPGWEANLYVKV